MLNRDPPSLTFKNYLRLSILVQIKGQGVNRPAQVVVPITDASRSRVTQQIVPTINIDGATDKPV